jgi:putative intracellular protease/amidase
MKRRPIVFKGFIIWSAIAAALGMAVLTRPASSQSAAPAFASFDETIELLIALRPPKRVRPVIAVIGANSGTETTDYLIPFGVLKRADIGEVIALATGSGPIKMMPALTIIPDATVTDFDAQHPEGADYVIVPAIHNDNDATTLRWIKEQKAKGAIIVGICAGARVLANAGLLDGRRATTHWYDVPGLRKRHPTTQYVANQRFVVDTGVVTTTGVSASIPMSLTLIEAIAGTDRAMSIARDLGIEHWDARHDSGAFRLDRNFVTSYAGNSLAFWRHETLSLTIEPGVDEVALGLTADAWSRTYRSKVAIYAANGGAITTRSGIGIMVDHVGPAKPPALDHIPSTYPARALDAALRGIGNRYGLGTRTLVSKQLEYSEADHGELVR